MEEACSELDFNLAKVTVDNGDNSSAFNKLSGMQVELETQRKYAEVIKEIITFYTLTMDGAGDICGSLKEDLGNTQQFISDKVPNIIIHTSGNALIKQATEISDFEHTLKKKFDFSNGTIYSSLDKSFQALRVKRQAYQGGTFIGNHVHKLLKVDMY